MDEQQAAALSRAGYDARLALFDAIRERAVGATSAQIVSLAEAWAWLTAPAQPHGGGQANKSGGG